MTLEIADEVVVSLKNNVQDCIVRVQTKRIRLDTNARQLLEKQWRQLGHLRDWTKQLRPANC